MGNSRNPPPEFGPEGHKGLVRSWTRLLRAEDGAWPTRTRELLGCQTYLRERKPPAPSQKTFLAFQIPSKAVFINRVESVALGGEPW